MKQKVCVVFLLGDCAIIVVSKPTLILVISWMFACCALPFGRRFVGNRKDTDGWMRMLLEDIFHE